MAKPTTTSTVKTTNNQPLIPKQTDPRAELFYLLGVLKGRDVEGYSRIVELVIDLTAQAQTPAIMENE